MTIDADHLTFLESKFDIASSVDFEAGSAQVHMPTIPYADFLAQKAAMVQSNGIVVQDSDINQEMFPFQRMLTRWAARKGQCAIFADTGMGRPLCSSNGRG